MKRYFLTLIFLSLPLIANLDINLVKSAKRSGLKAIPTDKNVLNMLIDPNSDMTDRKIELGKKLFFDKRLSKDNTINCASCHNLKEGGADGLSVAIGIKGQKNPHHLNSPTVYNSVLFDVQFWDGRSPNLADQAKGPLLSPFEMGMTPKLAENRINSIKGYVKEFKEAYGNNVKITFDLIASTISIFEKTLITPSRFDDYLNGDTKALSLKEKKGLQTFIDRGCINCHTGIAIGGSMQPFAIADEFKFKDIGDFKGDKDGLVKVPSLRNVVLNSPYFHNGTVVKLSDAIKEMSRIQLSITDIEDYEIENLIAFLNSLVGRKPSITEPKLPKE